MVFDHSSERGSIRASDKNRDRIASDDAMLGLRWRPRAHTGEIGLIPSANNSSEEGSHRSIFETHEASSFPWHKMRAPRCFRTKKGEPRTASQFPALFDRKGAERIERRPDSPSSS